MTLANTVKKALREEGIEVVSCSKGSQWVDVLLYDVVITNKKDFTRAIEISRKAIKPFDTKKYVNLKACVTVVKGDASE